MFYIWASCFLQVKSIMCVVWPGGKSSCMSFWLCQECPFRCNSESRASLAWTVPVTVFQYLEVSSKAVQPLEMTKKRSSSLKNAQTTFQKLQNDWASIRYKASCGIPVMTCKFYYLQYGVGMAWYGYCGFHRLSQPVKELKCVACIIGSYAGASSARIM